MRTITAIVLACCLAMSSATFNLLKSKSQHQTRAQIERYRPLNYLRAPLEVPVPVPVSTFSKHVQTYRVSPPPLPPPIPTFVVPQVYSVPVAVGPPVVGFSDAYPVYVEPPPSPPVLEEVYSACDENSGSFLWK